jgi:anti-sigma regulatory factor (Ser/Thr protein kinase)
MAPLTTYTVTCWREGTTWTVHIVQLDRRTRAARFSEVDAVARRVIVAVTGADPATIDVVVDLRVPEGLSRLLDAVADARKEADVISVEAVALRRTLARRLTAHGYGVGDIAALLGISHARARQLTSEVSELMLAGRHRQASGEPVAPAAPKAHTGYQHEAFFYRNDVQFLAGTVPFVQDALAFKQPIMVALPQPRLKQLQAALGPSASEVIFIDLGVLGSNPARIIPAWLDFLQRHPGRAVRGIGEPQWPGRRPEEVLECQLHEGLLNVAIDPDIPFWLRCPYDVADLPEPVSQAALDSHPGVVEVGGYRGSTSYGGLHHVESIFHSSLPPEPADCDLVHFGAADLETVRIRVGDRARAAGLDADRTRSLSGAVAEIAADAIRHGGGDLRTWTQSNALVCQISDRRELTDPLVGRRPPAVQGQEPCGFWLANQVSDLVQIRTGPEGSTARVFAWF